MELQGKIIAVLPARSGVSRSGNQWTSQEYVVETQGNYKTKMCFTVFGEDRIQQFGINQGDEVLIRFDIDAHEYNGRWFNEIRAYNVTKVGASAQPEQTHSPVNTSPVNPTSEQTTLFHSEVDNNDDLPF